MSASLIYETMAEAWEHRAPSCDFRCFKTVGFRVSGSGNSYQIIKRFGDTFVAGYRANWWHDAHLGTQIHLDKAMRNARAVNRWGSALYNCLPSESPSSVHGLFNHLSPRDYFSRIWFIAKSDRVHILNMLDGVNRPFCGINNLFETIGCYNEVQNLNTWPSGTPIRDFMHRHRLTAFPRVAPNTIFDRGLTLFEDGSWEPLGFCVEDPVVQIYDKGLYKKGLHGIRNYVLYRTMYKRHGLYDPNLKTDYTFEEVFFDLVNKCHKGPVKPEVLNTIPIQKWFPSYSYYVDQEPPLVTHNTLYRHWRDLCMKYGVLRIVPRALPRYTEAPNTLSIQSEPNYDELILAP